MVPNRTKTQAGTNEGRPVSVPLHKINRLPQMRGLFDPKKIHELALSIDVEGVLEDPGAILLSTDEHSIEFLDVFNKVKKTSITLRDLRTFRLEGEEVRCVLIFGERRIRALLEIWEFGKPTIDRHLGQKRPGNYFRKHFGNDLVRLNCFENGDALKALSRQFAENTYDAPLPWEKATAETEFYTFNKLIAEREGKKYSVSDYARERNLSYEVARSLINWTSLLPPDVQQLVVSGTIDFGISQQLLRVFRYAEKHIEDEVERRQFFDAIVVIASDSKKTCGSFKKDVDTWIADHRKDQIAKDSNQYELSGLMQDAAQRANLLLSRKRELSRSTEMSLRSLCSSVRTWKAFLDSGRFAPKDSPLLAGSVRRQVVKAVEALEVLLEAGEWLASPEIHSQLSHLAEAIPSCMAKLDELYPNGELLHSIPDPA